jgi:hypothetical protein
LSIKVWYANASLSAWQVLELGSSRRPVFLGPARLALAVHGSIWLGRRDEIGGIFHNAAMNGPSGHLALAATVSCLGLAAALLLNGSGARANRALAFYCGWAALWNFAVFLIGSDFFPDLGGVVLAVLQAGFILAAAALTHFCFETARDTSPKFIPWFYGAYLAVALFGLAGAYLKSITVAGRAFVVAPGPAVALLPWLLLTPAAAAVAALARARREFPQARALFFPVALLIALMLRDTIVLNSGSAEGGDVAGFVFWSDFGVDAAGIFVSAGILYRGWLEVKLDQSPLAWFCLAWSLFFATAETLLWARTCLPSGPGPVFSDGGLAAVAATIALAVAALPYSRGLAKAPSPTNTPARAPANDLARQFFIAASATRDPQTLKDALRRFLFDGMGVRRYILFLRDEATLEFAPFDFNPAHSRPVPRAFDANSPVSRLFLLERPAFARLPDPKKRESASELATASFEQLRGWDAEWCFPLFAGAELEGLLALGGPRDSQAFTTEEAGSISFAAGILGMLASEFSVRDQLEMLRGLSRDVAREIEEAAGRSKSLAELVDGAAQPPRLREQLAAAQRGIEALYACADETRYFSGGRPTQALPIRLDQAIQRAVRRAETRGRKKGVRITVAPMAAHQVEGDEALIIRMIFNVVCNAIDGSDANSQIEVELRPLHKEPDRPAWLRVRVLDWGSGISEASLKRLASGPFGAPCEEPAGLALAIARSIARRHGGQLAIFSEEEIGACVEIDLPGVAMPRPEDAAETLSVGPDKETARS